MGAHDSAHTRREVSVKTMAIINLLLTIAVALVVAIFAAQNPTPIELQFLALRSVEIPLGLAMTGAASLGSLTAALVFLLWPRPLPESAQQLQSRLATLESVQDSPPASHEE